MVMFTLGNKMGLVKGSGTSVIFGVLFVLVSCYVVLFYEHLDGKYLDFFFQTVLYEVFSKRFDLSFVNDWYSNYNKIIFPIYFWTVIILCLGVQHVAQRNEFDRKRLSCYFRLVFLYHSFLLLLTFSKDYTPGLGWVPGVIPSLEILPWYASVILCLFFSGYYGVCINVLYSHIREKRIAWDLFLPLSMLVPFFYLEEPGSHFYWIAVGYFLNWAVVNLKGHWRVNEAFKFPWTLWISIGVLFLLSLFFRVKYAGFFSSFDDKLMIFSADGDTYFNRALEMAEGHFEGDFWFAPQYSLYLAGFMTLFGSSSEAVYFSQAVVGAFVPVVIFLILFGMGFGKTGFLAGFLVSMSPLCIHASVVINRSAPQLLTISSMVLLCVYLKDRFRPLKVFLIGLLAGTTFYFGPETLPIILLVIVYLFYRTKSTGGGRSLKLGAIFLIGVLISVAPLNLIYYDNYKKWIPLGRDDSNFDATSTWNYGNSPAVLKMVEMGFNPIEEPKKSVDLFLKHPGKVISLLFSKLLAEVPGFLWDPAPSYLMPLHLSQETFYGAHIQFYFYFFILAGLFLIIGGKEKIPFPEKCLLLGIPTLQALFTSLVIFGTYRFRAPIAPINLIFAAFAMQRLFFFDLPSQSLANVNHFSSRGSTGNIDIKGRWKLAAGGFGLVLITILAVRLDFLEMAGHSKGRQAWFPLKNNSELLLYFDNPLISSWFLSFNMCHSLIPENKVFFRIIVDGNRTEKTKNVPGGCHTYKEPIHSKMKIGSVGLWVYLSQDGTPPTGTLRLPKIEKIPKPPIYLFNFPGSTREASLRRLKTKFKMDSIPIVKVSQPEVIPISSASH